MVSDDLREVPHQRKSFLLIPGKHKSRAQVSIILQPPDLNNPRCHRPPTSMPRTMAYIINPFKWDADNGVHKVTSEVQRFFITPELPIPAQKQSVFSVSTPPFPIDLSPGVVSNSLLHHNTPDKPVLCSIAILRRSWRRRLTYFDFGADVSRYALQICYQSVEVFE
jgi:hypothetical protein